MKTRPLSARRRLAFAALACTVGVLLFLGLAEALLRLAPGLLRPGLGNHVYSKYGTFAGGIYHLEESTKMLFMRPGFRTRAYWNGRVWTHETDSWGFRNPEKLSDRSILLLGDSVIYGHGVEQSETAANVLRTDFDRSAYNMARQGDCLYQSYVLARLFLERFDPEAIVLFVFGNDPHDLLAHRTEQEIREAAEIHFLDYEALFERVQSLDADRIYRSRDRWHRVLLWRLKEGLKRELGRTPVRELVFGPGPSEAGSRGDRPHPSVQLLLDDPRVELVRSYYERILPDLQARTLSQGSRLKMVFLDFGDQLGPGSVRAQRRLRHFVRDIAEDSGIAFQTTGDLWRDCSECFLANDGHLTPEGHRRLAVFLDDKVL